MKKIIPGLLTLLFCSVLLIGFSCSKSNNGGGSSATGNGTFTATINGKTFSNSGSSSNAVLIVKADPNAGFDPRGDIFIELNGAKDSLGMHVPDQLGTDTLGIGVYYGVYTGLSTPYIFTSVIVHVTTLTSNRIKGDFSGQATPDNAPNGPFIPITNASFDVPLN